MKLSEEKGGFVFWFFNKKYAFKELEKGIKFLKDKEIEFESWGWCIGFGGKYSVEEMMKLLKPEGVESYVIVRDEE